MSQEISSGSVIEAIENRQRQEAHDFNLSDHTIHGELDLSFRDLPFPLIFRNCRFQDDIIIENSRFRSLSFSGCQCQGIRGRNTLIDGDLVLNNGFHSAGLVQIEGSVLNGSLIASMAIFDDPSASRCLQGKGLQIRGDIRAEGSCFRGEVKLANTTVGGDAIFANCLFHSNNYAINLSSAHIAGQLLLERTGVYGENRGLREGRAEPFFADGPGPPASARCFQSIGTVTLDNAKIGSDLVLSNAILVANSESDKPALGFSNAQIGGNVYLRNDFSAYGAVEMRNARIRGSLDCTGGSFFGPQQPSDRDAVGAFGLHVDGEVIFGSPNVDEEGISACIKGALNFNSCHVATNFRCCDVAFEAPTATETHAPPWNGLDLTNATVTGEIQWRHNRLTPTTILRLSYARAGTYTDDMGQGIQHGCLFLDGFTYNKLSHGIENVGQRLSWLGLQPLHKKSIDNEYLIWPQTFDELGRFYQSVGLPGMAKRVLFEKEEEFLKGTLLQFRDTAGRNWWHRLRRRSRLLIEISGRLFLKSTIGYGYRFHYLILYFLVLLSLGTVIFSIAGQNNYMQRIDADLAQGSAMAHHEMKPPLYNPLLYSFDTLVPVVNIHQYNYWTPEPAPQGNALYANLLQLYLCCHILAGWIITSLVVSGITGVFKR